MKRDPTYLAVLQEELRHAQARKERAGCEGLLVVEQQIQEIQRDIRRYSAILENPPQKAAP